MIYQNMFYKIGFIVIAFSLSVFVSFGQKGFVQVDGTHFKIDGESYHYIGANFWQAMNLASKGAGGDREQLIKELDHLKSIGVTNLRIVAGSEGPDTEPYRMLPAMQTAPGKYNEDLLDGLDFVLAEMAKRDMKAIMCLNNFWPWSGGMGQYMVWAGVADSIPYPPPAPNGDWDKYQKFTAQFYDSKKAMKMFEDHIKFIVKRKNSYTKKKYTDDPTIMTWELGNEPRGINNVKAYMEWVDKTSSLIKKLDDKHLVTIGSEGYTSAPDYAGTNFKPAHSLPTIDYVCVHVWIQNFGWYDPMKPAETFYPSLEKAYTYFDKHIKESKEMNKPLVLEEFGCARDSNSYNPTSITTVRNQYFHLMFERAIQNADVVAGANFWAWAGESTPKLPYGSIWEKGDPFIGDPPHEHQGWYSVYATDATTIAVIKEYANKMKAIK